MPTGTIKLQIDKEDFDKVKKQLLELYEIAEKSNLKVVEITKFKSNRLILWASVILLAVSSFEIGYIIGRILCQ